jgi:hypothetical protein
MATFAQVRTKANDRLALLWNAITNKQDAYFQKYGTYFGLNWSPSLVPFEGADTPFTVNRPSRFHNAIDVDFSSESDVPFSLLIIRHDGATQGYTCTIRITHADTTYQRSRSHLGDDTGWQIVIPTP